jgi:hypothetical protein
MCRLAHSTWAAYTWFDSYSRTLLPPPRSVLVPAGRRTVVGPFITEPFLPRRPENNFQLDWSAERKGCYAVHQAARTLVFSEDVLFDGWLGSVRLERVRYGAACGMW